MRNDSRRRWRPATAAKVLRAAAAAGLAALLPAAAWAGEPSRDAATPPQQQAAPAPPAAAGAAPAAGAAQQAPARRPLMSLLDRAGLAGPLDRAGIQIYGHVEGGYTWNFEDPDSELNPYRIFDFEHDEPLLNQVDLTIERLVDYRLRKWDLGGRVEFLYGADAGIVHSNGLFDWYDSPRHPENQFDLLQAYLDVTVPVGTGLRIRGGKFVNFVGYESVNPTAGGIVDFYSRSLTFFNYPFTHTGLLFTYDLTPDVTLTLGASRGDNQSVEDNNDAISFLGSINWVINDRWALYVSNSTGPERTDDDDDVRMTWDATLFFRPDERTTAALNAYYVWEEAASANEPGEDADLIALSLLAAYDLSRHLTIKGRAEWIHSSEGYRLGAGINDIYEVTVGLTIRPFPDDELGRHLKIRPELRYDWCPDDVFNGEDEQLTAAIDLVFAF